MFNVEIDRLFDSDLITNVSSVLALRIHGIHVHVTPCKNQRSLVLLANLQISKTQH
jgi:hypothetical protein